MGSGRLLLYRPARVELHPAGVEGFDQGVFLLAVPLFDLKLPGTGGGFVRLALEVNELVAVVAAGEVLFPIAAVLPETALQVAGGADIHDPVRPVGEDVDAEIVHGAPLLRSDGCPSPAGGRR